MAKTKFYIFTVLIAIICICAVYDSMTGITTGVCNKYITDQVTFGANLNDYFDSELDRNDICMFDGNVNLQGDSANTKEVLMLNHMNREAGPSTALTSNREYDDIVLEVDRRSIKLYYIFDNSIDVTRASLDHPLETSFLGDSFKIARVDSATRFLAYVGDEYQLYIGNTIVVNNKTLQLKKVGQNGAIIVEVDGVTETLSRGSTETVNGIEITNVESFYDPNNLLNNLAELIVGGEAVLTIRNGDYYSDNPDWTWTVGGLTTATSTTTSTTAEFSGPYIGIENYIEYDSTSDTITEGDCLSLPNNYISICHNGTTTRDYVNLEIDTDTVDASPFGGGTADSGMHFKTSDSALRIDGTRTNEAWIVGANLYYERDGVRQAGFNGVDIGTIEDLEITRAGNLYTLSSPVANDDITFVYTTSLGTLQWNGRTVDEDDDGKLVTRYGVIIKDIDDDDLELRVPDNQVRAVINIISTAT